MPRGNNSVYAPASTPIFDPAPVRGERKIYTGGAAGAELPPYSIAGPVDGVGISPGYPIRAQCTVRSCVVEVGSAGGTSVDFAILVNGTSVSTHTVSSSGSSSHVESIALAVNDIVALEITDPGTGALNDLLIVLRL